VFSGASAVEERRNGNSASKETLQHHVAGFGPAAQTLNRLDCVTGGYHALRVCRACANRGFELATTVVIGGREKLKVGLGAWRGNNRWVQAPGDEARAEASKSRRPVTYP
jgi:hypothetical protein